MHFVWTHILNTVIAYDVRQNNKPIGQVWLRDEYWHAKATGKPHLTQGGPGYVQGRGYQSRNEAGDALSKEMANQ